jgi:hypothetical protein
MAYRHVRWVFHFPTGPDGPSLRRPGDTWMAASYGANRWMVPAPLLDSDFAFLNESAVSRPGRTPIFGDSVYQSFRVQESDEPTRDLYYGKTPPPSPSGISAFMLARHGGRSTARSSLPVEPGQSLDPYVNHLVFFDGHVERVRLEDLWTLHWHRNWEPPATRPP